MWGVAKCAKINRTLPTSCSPIGFTVYMLLPVYMRIFIQTLGFSHGKSVISLPPFPFFVEAVTLLLPKKIAAKGFCTQKVSSSSQHHCWALDSPCASRIWWHNTPFTFPFRGCTVLPQTEPHAQANGVSLSNKNCQWTYSIQHLDSQLKRAENPKNPSPLKLVCWIKNMSGPQTVMGSALPARK